MGTDEPDHFVMYEHEELQRGSLDEFLNEWGEAWPTPLEEYMYTINELKELIPDE